MDTDPPDIDDLDRAILYALQRDARRNTNADIASRLDVSPSTISKRVTALESAGVIRGFHTDIDYEQAGFPLSVLFVCTAAVSERESMAQSLLDLDSVVNVRELMTGVDNIHVIAVGASNDDITNLAHDIDRIGLDITDETLLRDEYDRPSTRLREAPDPDTREDS